MVVNCSTFPSFCCILYLAICCVCSLMFIISILTMQVTTKGTNLNPNAKVWQEIPAQQNDIPEVSDGSSWLHTNSSSGEMTDGMRLVGSCSFCFHDAVIKHLMSYVCMILKSVLCGLSTIFAANSVNKKYEETSRLLGLKCLCRGKIGTRSADY